MNYSLSFRTLGIFFVWACCRAGKKLTVAGTKNMTTIDILGFTDAFCTTFSFLPQALKVFKTRDTKSLSLVMYSVLTVGVALWLAYGLLKQDAAVIVANMITLLLAVAILGIKIHNDVILVRRCAETD